MKTITIFGLLYSQHISNFTSSIKKYSDYHLIGVNNNPSLIQGEQYYKQTKASFDEILEINRCKNRLADLFVKCISPLKLISRASRKSDVVQFHYISYFVLPLIIVVKIVSKAKISSFVYGSDFLGVSSIKQRYLNLVFQFSDSVVCDSSTVLEEMKNKYPQYSEKIECCFFGSVIIDKLLDLKEKPFTPLINTNKKVIMCGYNGAIQQQHINIIQTLRAVANQYYWLIPMTYGGTIDYKDKVKKCLEDFGVEYTILDTFLSEEDWINYLRTTDIFIHMQKTDAFSAALSEQLILGHIVINGEWLPYKDFDDNDVFYFKSNFYTLESDIDNILNNYNKYSDELKRNQEKIEKIKGLRYCIINYWLPYFDRLSN